MRGQFYKRNLVVKKTKLVLKSRPVVLNRGSAESLSAPESSKGAANF